MFYSDASSCRGRYRRGMTDPRDAGDPTAGNLACGLWAGLVAVLLLAAIVAVALFGFGLTG